jgi:hypothetical protein
MDFIPLSFMVNNMLWKEALLLNGSADAYVDVATRSNLVGTGYSERAHLWYGRYSLLIVVAETAPYAEVQAVISCGDRRGARLEMEVVAIVKVSAGSGKIYELRVGVHIVGAAGKVVIAALVRKVFIPGRTHRI